MKTHQFAGLLGCLLFIFSPVTLFVVILIAVGGADWLLHQPAFWLSILGTVGLIVFAQKRERQTNAKRAAKAAAERAAQIAAVRARMRGTQ